MRENRTYSLSGGRWPARKRATSDPTPMKGSNKEGQPTAESLEGRPGTKENPQQPHMRPTQGGPRMSQGLEGVRQAAFALTPSIQGRSRMREIRSYGSERGVLGDRHPYRDFQNSCSSLPPYLPQPRASA